MAIDVCLERKTLAVHLVWMLHNKSNTELSVRLALNILLRSLSLWQMCKFALGKISLIVILGQVFVEGLNRDLEARDSWEDRHYLLVKLRLRQ